MSSPRKRPAGPKKLGAQPRTRGLKTGPGNAALAPRVGALAVSQSSEADALFARIVSILEETRSRTARAVNLQTVTAYWHIGREIVEALQGGEPRAEYGVRLIEELSRRLTQKYGAGFSVPNLKNFRQFYRIYVDRSPVSTASAGSRSAASPKGYPAGSQFMAAKPSSLSGGESMDNGTRHRPSGASALGFHAALSWSHYRALMRVEKLPAREFYEQEAVACGWNKVQLERQIETLYYERLLMSRDKKGMLTEARQAGGSLRPIDTLKDPYVLEFLDLPDSPRLHESELEAAIIANMQSFLLELGKGFAFVARQKRMRLEDEDFYVDLVFYNYLLKCFVLCDLKVGRLTHQDIGQMDTYVRMFEAHEKPIGDNPTIGLILCSKKNEAVAKYSVLSESRQLFAARYLTYLPTEEELERELERERQLIEAGADQGRDQRGREPTRI